MFTRVAPRHHLPLCVALVACLTAGERRYIEDPDSDGYGWGEDCFPSDHQRHRSVRDAPANQQTGPVSVEEDPWRLSAETEACTGVDDQGEAHVLQPNFGHAVASMTPAGGKRPWLAVAAPAETVGGSCGVGRVYLGRIGLKQGDLTAGEPTVGLTGHQTAGYMGDVLLAADVDGDDGGADELLASADICQGADPCELTLADVTQVGGTLQLDELVRITGAPASELGSALLVVPEPLSAETHVWVTARKAGESAYGFRATELLEQGGSLAAEDKAFTVLTADPSDDGSVANPTQLGTAIAALDLKGDCSYALAVGAPHFNPGSSDGLGSGQVLLFEPPDAGSVAESEAMAESDAVALHGEAGNGYDDGAGAVIAASTDPSVGDLDGDGLSELVVAATQGGEADNGYAYVVSSSQLSRAMGGEPLALADANLVFQGEDHENEPLEGGGQTSPPAWQLHLPGDLDQDGEADLMVASPSSAGLGGSVGAGTAWLIYGPVDDKSFGSRFSLHDLCDQGGASAPGLCVQIAADDDLHTFGRGLASATSEETGTVLAFGAPEEDDGLGALYLLALP